LVFALRGVAIEGPGRSEGEGKGVSFAYAPGTVPPPTVSVLLLWQSCRISGVVECS